MAHISVVIPVYKAEDCLAELYRRLCQSLIQITDNFEIILIEDCGGDKSWDVIVELAKKDPRVIGLQFSRNFGQHYGITAGLDHCSGEWVVVMDCDLQDRPEEIPRLYAKAREGFDIVLADRGKRQDAFIKRITSQVFYKIFSYLLGTEYNGNTGNFRIISRKVVNNFLLMREQLRFFGALVNWMGFSTTTIEVEHANRYAGQSTYTYKKLLKLAIDATIAFSDKPLRLVVKLGFFISFFAFVIGIYIFFKALFHHSPVLGWSSLIVSIYFLGGIMIGILGIIGIYLGKTFDEIKKRPLYIINRTTITKDKA